jgi:preprotein translocase subunit SecF
MYVVNNRKIFYIISVILVALSVFSLLTYGLSFGIDFRGGSILEVEYAEQPPMERVEEIIRRENLGESSIRPTNDNGYIIRLKNLTEPERANLVSKLSEETGAEVKRFDSVGPILGRELQRKALISLILVILAIVLFVTFVFRKVSQPVSSWKYGLVTIVALVHDVVVPLGFFSVYGHFYGFDVDTLFVTAILVVLGFSVHDTIVVFDRVRENLKNAKSSQSFEEIVGGSIRQTLTRSINTTVTVLFSLIALYIFGAEATRNFSLVMFVGLVGGAYSSIFLASPLLVTLQKWSLKNK